MSTPIQKILQAAGYKQMEETTPDITEVMPQPTDTVHALPIIGNGGTIGIQ
jgi:hypothetical protein